MPTIIIHPTHTPEMCIKHDGPQARSWVLRCPTPTIAPMTVLEQPPERDAPGVLKSDTASDGRLIVIDVIDMHVACVCDAPDGSLFI